MEDTILYPSCFDANAGIFEALLGEQSVSGRPILELKTTGSQQAGDGVAAEAEQAAQGEGLCALGGALLGEGGEAFLPELEEGGEESGRVFFRTGAGAWGRRRASKDLCSTNHSTISPLEKSMAWARAEGKLIYH